MPAFAFTTNCPPDYMNRESIGFVIQGSLVRSSYEALFKFQTANTVLYRDISSKEKSLMGY